MLPIIFGIAVQFLNQDGERNGYEITPESDRSKRNQAGTNRHDGNRQRAQQQSLCRREVLEQEENDQPYQTTKKNNKHESGWTRPSASKFSLCYIGQNLNAVHPSKRCLMFVRRAISTTYKDNLVSDGAVCLPPLSIRKF